MDLIDLCRLPKREKSSLTRLKRAALATLQRCVSDDDAADWFLHWLFFQYPKIDDAIRQEIVAHANCPDSVLLTAMKYQPAWAENSAALSIRKLNALTQGTDYSWDDRLEQYLENSLEWHFNRMIDGPIYDREYQAMCPEFVIRHILENGPNKDIKRIGDWGLPGHQPLFAGHRNFRVRIELTQFPRLRKSYMLALAQDEKVSVRKALAARRSLSDDALKLLANDDSDQVRRALFDNDNLPKEKIEKLTSADYNRRTKRLDGNTGVETARAALTLLAGESVDQDTLGKLAAHEAPVVRCAAVLHANADESIFAIAMKKLAKTSRCSGKTQAQPPETWMVSPIARRTTNARWIKQFAQDNDPDVIYQLVHNPRVTRTMMLDILERPTTAYLRAAIAAVCFDDKAVMAKIFSGRTSPNDWEPKLAAALDPARKKGELLKLHRDPDCPFLCLSKAIARHPSCPKDLHSVFSWYLPEDYAKNPVNKGVKPADRIQGWEAQDWYIAKKLSEGEAQAFLVNHHARENIEFARMGISCLSIDDTLLLELALSDDNAVEKRLVNREARELPRFVYEVLFFSKRSPVRKLLAERADTPESILLSLCNDKDQSVALAASKRVGSKKRSVSKQAAVTIDKSSVKSLGNKAVRIDLAKTATDKEILVLLCTDRVVDVRQIVASRTDLPVSHLLVLARDTDEVVRLHALRNLDDNKNKTAVQTTEYQAILHEIVDSGTDKQSLLLHVASKLEDTARLIKLHARTTDSIVHSEILRHIHSPEILDAEISRIIRGGKSNKRFSPSESIEAICENPVVSASQVRKLLDIPESESIHILSSIKAASVFMAVIRDSDLSELDDHRLYLPMDIAADQLDHLFAIDARILFHAADHLYKLGYKRCKKLFNESDEMRELLLQSRNLSASLVGDLLKWCEERGSSDDLSTLFAYQKPPQAVVDKYVTSGDLGIRVEIAANQPLDEEQLQVLAKDKNPFLRRCILSRVENGLPLPDAVLKTLASDNKIKVAREARNILDRQTVSGTVGGDTDCE